MRNDIWAYVAGVASGAAVAGLLWFGFALANPTSADNDPEAMAAQFDIAIVWSTAPCEGALGCHWTQTPDVIYVDPTLDAAQTKHVVLHELGHVMQYRLGLPNDQCGADRFAESLGGGAPTYCG
jgi:hypothetical protein